MAIQDHLSTSLAKAVKNTGSQSAFGDLIGKHQSTIHDWLREGKPLPAEHVLIVEAATGISRHDLRPDIYPVESSGTASPPEGTPATVSEYSVAGVPQGLKGLRS